MLRLNTQTLSDTFPQVIVLDLTADFWGDQAFAIFPTVHI